MKRISFCRKSILRAIHAACVALFLFAAQRGAEAQSYTAPFHISGSAVSTNANGTFTSPVGFYDATNSYNTFSVGSGVTINSNSGYGIYGTYHTMVLATTDSFSNAGSLNLNTTSGSYQSTVALSQGATSLNLTNSGTITSLGTSLNVASALIVSSSSGNATLNNSGTILGGGANNEETVYLLTTSGTMSLTNSASGQITCEHGFAIYAQSSGSGAFTVTNDGAISATYEVMQLESQTGAIQITNNGTLSNTGSQDVIYAESDGAITVVNNGDITGTNSGYGIGGENRSSSGSAISLINTGIISGVSVAGIGGYQYANAPYTISNSGTITSSYAGIYGSSAGSASSFQIRNTGNITASGYGIYVFSPATVYNSGNITAPTAISVPNGSSVTLSGRPIISGTISGNDSSTSTSQLTFALNIPAANLTAAKAQLDAEITAYDTQNGGNYTFTVDGLTFDISNFDYTNITDDLATVIARLYARTPGFASEGTVLDNLNTNNTQASTILNALGNVPDAGVANALGELSPKVLEIFSNVANNVATFNTAKINNHLANERDGLTGFDATALNVQDSGMDPTLNQVRDHLLAYNPIATPGLMSDTVDSLFGGTDMKSAQVNTMPTARWSSFIAGDVILADLSHNTNLEDANYTTGNVTAGVDYRLDDHFTVGALFAYSHTAADLDSRGSSATVDSYSPGIYASYVDKGWYGNFLGAYGRNAYTSDRMVDIPGLQGDNHGATSGNQGTINLTGGYEFQKGSFKFGPVASVQYVHLALDSMQEQGPTALTIDSQDQDSFRSQIGVEGRFNANFATPFGPVSFTPHVSLSWQHEYLDDSRGINAQFTGTGGGSFVTQTDNPDRDAAFIDVGLDAEVAKNVTVFVDYETQAGQQNYFAQSAEGGVKIGF